MKHKTTKSDCPFRHMRRTIQEICIDYDLTYENAANLLGIGSQTLATLKKGATFAPRH